MYVTRKSVPPSSETTKFSTDSWSGIDTGSTSGVTVYGPAAGVRSMRPKLFVVQAASCSATYALFPSEATAILVTPSAPGSTAPRKLKSRSQTQRAVTSRPPSALADGARSSPDTLRVRNADAPASKVYAPELFAPTAMSRVRSRVSTTPGFHASRLGPDVNPGYHRVELHWSVSTSIVRPSASDATAPYTSYMAERLSVARIARVSGSRRWIVTGS